MDEEKPVDPVADLPRKREKAGWWRGHCLTDAMASVFGSGVVWGQVEEVGRKRKSELSERASKTYIYLGFPFERRP
jgi:hypothetical protein